MTLALGAYTLSEGIYKGVTLTAPEEFWKNFDEKKLRAAGYG